jgi:MazG family protein
MPHNHRENTADCREQTGPGPAFERLVEIMAQLRSPGGCPWDREQTFDTIKPYLLEETYEVMDAIDARDWDGLAEELGDLLLQPVFFAQMAAEEGRFTIADSLNAIVSKLVRRHPHVFAAGDAKTADDVKRRWDEIKAEEKLNTPKLAGGGAKPKGLLDGVPRSVPALVEAQHIASRAAGVGFDWENVDQVFEKLDEETRELHAARNAPEPDREAMENEVGDMLFVIVNIARFLKVDPEQALRKTNAKFRRRFGHVETGLAAQGKSTREATVEEMEALWQDAKASERNADGNETDAEPHG